MNDPKFTLPHLLKNPSFTAVSALLLASGAGSTLLAQTAATAPPETRSRPFRMGFTAFPPDVTAEALRQTRQFVRTNADLIAHHIEGVPWAEALRNEPFPKQLLSDWETKRSMKPPGASVYLAISPGRGELKLAEKGATPLPPELRGKSYDDPSVKRACLIHQDYDALWETIKATAPELFIAWRDCGLIDERGQPRPAYAVLRDYFDRSFRDPAEKP